MTSGGRQFALNISLWQPSQVEMMCIVNQEMDLQSGHLDANTPITSYIAVPHRNHLNSLSFDFCIRKRRAVPSALTTT